MLSTDALLVFELGAMKRSFGPARSKSTAKIRNGEKFANSSEICQTALSPVGFQSPKRHTGRALALSRIFLHIGDSGAERVDFELTGDLCAGP